MAQQVEDIWCCTCGDRTTYANDNNREIRWYLKDTKRGIGICETCSLHLNKEDLVLPEDHEDKQ